MPNPGDSGSCIGVAQKVYERKITMENSYLGHDIPESIR